MATETSADRFSIGLYEEHLEEASFLAEQRYTLSDDPELGWRELDEFEARLEAHVDALVVGGRLGLDVCRRRAREGDAWERHAALRVFCRQGRKDYLLEALAGIDAEDPQASLAATRALRQEVPTAWQGDLLELLQGEQHHLDDLVASVAGYRRLAGGPALLARLTGADESAQASIAWALGRTGDATAIPGLLASLEGGGPAVREQAAVALLRLGDASTVRNGLLVAQHSGWPRRALGIGGDRSAINVLLDVLKGKQADEQCVLSLGLLGDLGAVAPLVARLEDDALGEAAAVALNVITGAGLSAEVFVPDEIGEDELFDEERAAFAHDGTLPTRHGGEAYGSWQRRPLRTAAHWRHWLSEHRTQFDRNRRWRLGQLYGPTALVDCLLDAQTPQTVRAASYDELVCRYAMPIPFEVDLPVRQQDRFLTKIRAWAVEAESRFDAGGWYFAGQPQQ